MYIEQVIKSFRNDNTRASFLNGKRSFEPFHEKTNNVVFEQIQHKPSCRSTEDG